MEIKITVFTCLLSSEGCDSFPKHLGLALAPNKTNDGVKKQQNTQYHDKSWHIVTCLAVLRSHRALGAQSSTLPPAVRRPCTHGDIGRVLHQPWLSRARLMMPPQVAMLSVQRGRLSALSDVRRRLGQHSAGRTAAKLVVRARACFQRSEACWCISLAG